ncbi:MAG: hypothetical protein D6681_10775 [Calditrichaeota bacterium]|nr:MAG: hypothetical protein D6681_10775 [Calditrichota bacterium]
MGKQGYVLGLLIGGVIWGAMVGGLCQEQPRPKRIYRAVRANPHPPKIDGRLDDPVWASAPEAGGFIQTEPEEGQPPTYPTTFRILYDAHNLYIAIRAYDREPEKIVRRIARRDQGDEADLVGVLIDSYHDLRTAFQFAVNAAGVKMDAIWTEDGDNQDDNWDPVWYVKTAVDTAGWTAEMRIPLSQLRYGKQENPVWGLEVARFLYRKREWSMWQFIPQDAAGFVNHMGELHGLGGLTTPRRIELLPYTVGESRFTLKEAGNPFATGRDNLMNGGLDGKIGLTSDLTVDFTVNPDFGQVEADPSEVNLTAFETFFEEKRPFFIEGRNIFTYAVALGGGPFSRDLLFYSRRIGRRPHHYPDLGDDEYADVPENTSIIAAAKLTGKTRGGSSVAVLDALTARETAEIDRNGARRQEVVEPLTNYFVGRLQKDFAQGNTVIGGMVTAVHRNLHGAAHLGFLNRQAYSGGVDVLHQWNHRRYFLAVKTGVSHIRGSREAILEAQTAPQRYYQRPDATYLRLDSTRTSLTGHAGAVGFGKQGGGHWRFMVATIWRSPGFEINDVGFLRAADRVMSFGWLSYREWNPTGIFRNFQINLNLWRGWHFGREPIFTGGNINGGAQFKNYWSFWMGINREGPGLDINALRGGPALAYEGRWNHWFNISSDSRKALQIGVGGFNSFSDEGISRRHQVYMEFTWRPQDAATISLNPFYSFNRDDLQYVSTEELRGQERYIFARIDQKTLGLEFRFNLSLTPELSLQYWGQPFISAARYSRFKRITMPRADRYEDRFHTFAEGEIRYDAGAEEYNIDDDGDGTVDYTLAPDFNFQEFRSNLVIRWEYRPGSTLFLVWSQNRSQAFSRGVFAPGRDFDTLFDSHPDNIFLVKLNYWFAL